MAEKEQQTFITLVDQILAAKKKDPNADTSALEHEIDKMVYELYELTPEEIAIVEKDDNSYISHGKGLDRVLHFPID